MFRDQAYELADVLGLNLKLDLDTGKVTGDGTKTLTLGVPPDTTMLRMPMRVVASKVTEDRLAVMVRGVGNLGMMVSCMPSTMRLRMFDLAMLKIKPETIFQGRGLDAIQKTFDTLPEVVVGIFDMDKKTNTWRPVGR